MPCRSFTLSSSCKCPSATMDDEADGNDRLLFMTYNGWVMIAVAVGAFLGHITFGLKTTSEKTVACH
jgi:hypothetical protein